MCPQQEAPPGVQQPRRDLPCGRGQPGSFGICWPCRGLPDWGLAGAVWATSRLYSDFSRGERVGSPVGDPGQGGRPSWCRLLGTWARWQAGSWVALWNPGLPTVGPLGISGRLPAPPRGLREARARGVGLCTPAGRGTGGWWPLGLLVPCWPPTREVEGCPGACARRRLGPAPSGACHGHGLVVSWPPASPRRVRSLALPQHPPRASGCILSPEAWRPQPLPAHPLPPEGVSTWGPGPRVRGGGSGVAAAPRGSAARSVTLPRLLADYVYFENSSSNPYLIRRIEELNKVARAWAGVRVWAWV